MTEIKSKHGLVSRQPFELYMAFVDMRNFLQFLPEDKKADVEADYDTISTTVQGFKIGVMVKNRTPYSSIEFIDNGLRSRSEARCISTLCRATHPRQISTLISTLS